MEDRVKKGVVIALVLLALAALGYMATHKAPRPTPDTLTETAAQLGAPQKTAEQAPAAPAPAPAPAPVPTPAVPSQAATAVATPAPAAPGEFDLATAMSERSIGRDDAPVTVIEYSSLTCSHCAHFATEILPQVKTKLIDTGKLRMIFRDFPLDAMAMKAAKLSRCAPKDKYFDFLEVLFRNAPRWLSSKNPEEALRQMGALAGMDDTYMKSCMSSVELESALANGVQEAQGKFYIKATPTFIFDYGTETLTGAQDVSKFEEVVNRLSGGKKQ
jgi:protein-disulfide isomerase